GRSVRKQDLHEPGAFVKFRMISAAPECRFWTPPKDYTVKVLQHSDERNTPMPELETEQANAAQRMKLQTERFLERASRLQIDARRAYERLVQQLHRIGAPQVTTAACSIAN